MVPLVDDVHRPVGGNSNPGRLVELPVRVAVAAPLTEKGALGVEVLDAIVVGIRHVDRPVRSDRNAPRSRRQSGVAAGEFPVVAALPAPRAEEGAGGVEDLDALVAA